MFQDLDVQQKQKIRNCRDLGCKCLEGFAFRDFRVCVHKFRFCLGQGFEFGLGV